MDMTPPKLSSLADRAILVRLQRSMYQPYVYDKAATATVEHQTGVIGAGRYNKRLFRDNKVLAETFAKFNELYRFVNHETVPWLDDGVRMMPSAGYFEFTTEVRSKIAEAEKAADHLASVWEQLVAEDIRRLGPMGNATDYPDKYELRNRFGASVNFLPVPSSNDFRVQGITDEDKAKLDKMVNEAEANVRKYLIGELIEPLRKAAEKLAVPIGSEGHIFRDSLIENVVDAVNRASKLNINNDPEVAERAAEIGQILRNVSNVEALRESPIVRNSAKDRMNEILAKMGVS